MWSKGQKFETGVLIMLYLAWIMSDTILSTLHTLLYKKGEIQMAEKHEKRFSISLAILEMQIKTRYNFLPSDWHTQTHAQRGVTCSVGKGVEKTGTAYVIGSSVIWYIFVETVICQFVS